MRPRRPAAARPGTGGTASDGTVDEEAVASALDAMRTILQEVRVANRATEQELGISGAQLFVLEELGRAPADSLNDLALRAGTRHSSMSIVVTPVMSTTTSASGPSRRS